MSVVTPKVTITLDRERTIRFNKAGLQKYFDTTNRKPTDGFAIDTLDDACAFLYGGLTFEDPALTLEQVEDWMNPIVYAHTVKAFVEYLRLAAPAKVEQEQEANGVESPLAESSSVN
jgi:hypothetical protein